MKIDVIINTDKITISENYKVFCDICLKIGEEYFPDKLWNDFALIISGWWVDNFQRIDLENCTGEFMFMDGSYDFTIHRNKDDYVIILFEGDNLFSEYIIDDFQSILLKAKRQFRKLAFASLELISEPYKNYNLDMYGDYDNFESVMTSKKLKKMGLNKAKAYNLYENMKLIDKLIEFSSVSNPKRIE